MTATHVVANTYEGSLSVTFRNGVTKNARTVAQAKGSDFSLLEVGETDFPSITRPSSFNSALRVLPGTKVLAPFEQAEVFAVGSVDGKYVTAFGTLRSVIVDNAGWVVMEADAPARPGMSGGPVVNRCGELMGVVSLGARSTPYLQAIYLNERDVERMTAFAKQGTVTTFAPLPLPTPQKPRRSSWTHSGGDGTNARANREETTLVPPLSQKWAVDIGMDSHDDFLVDNGVVYVSGWSDKKQTIGGKEIEFSFPTKFLKAFDAATGRLLWTYPIQPLCNQLGQAIILNGVIYIRCVDSVHAISTVRPALVWSYDLRSDQIPTDFLQSISQHTVLLGTGDKLFFDVADTVESRKAMTGDILWRYRLQGGSVAAMAATTDTLFVFSDAGLLEALDVQSGKSRWRVEQKTVKEAQLVVSDLRLLILDQGSIRAAVNVSTGHLLNVNAQTSVFLGPFPQTVARGVYYGFQYARAYCSNPIVAIESDPWGVERWEAPMLMINDSRVGADSLAFANGYIWAGSCFGGFAAYDASSGKSIWREQSGNKDDVIRSIVPANGMLFGMTDTKLYAYGKP